LILCSFIYLYIHYTIDSHNSIKPIHVPNRVMNITEKSSAPKTNYTTYLINSWHQYQRVTASHLQTIQHYNETCETDAALYGNHVMVLRDNVVKITGYYWYSNGFPAQNCADTDGYVDVRTGKQYPRDGRSGSYFEDICTTTSSNA
jgi:hypothetical protein